MSHAKACFQQVKESLLDPSSKDPDGHSLVGTWRLDILEIPSEESS